MLDPADLRSAVPETPAFVYDEARLAASIGAARAAIAPTGARLLLALKAFCLVPGVRFAAPLLDGLHASSPFEARLARDILGDGGLVHTTMPGMRDADLAPITSASDFLSFNSLSQWQRLAFRAQGRASLGLRVNPGLSFVENEAYDPTCRNSKLGAAIDNVEHVLARSPGDLDGVEGILVNNCESTDFRELELVVDTLVERLDPLLRRVRWVNLGGGYLYHDTTTVASLHAAVAKLRDRYGVEVLFEPGTGLAADAGYLVATVVDIMRSGGQDIAVLDTTVAHLPEVFEFQFTPEVIGDGGPHRYVLAGGSCLSGDRFGEYGFEAPLEIGSRVVFEQVGAYSMVKTSWFNGIAPPTVFSRSSDGTLVERRRFTYDDFRCHSAAAPEDVRG